ncbi:acetylornithine deacetylase [Litoreibacter ponti]|uniref:Acetylornithine deacetylase n=1 Tax=Litoreibacter ponti TaxID=1510457 RepID=A0A2T6BK13_9RHOB|nr:acetylornithine deacetylase [Litoreibacter ponti]PTX56398.1 acetylornithine deacetylase [Litoreibacter ponti]
MTTPDQPTSVEHLRKLVGFDTISDRSNLVLLDYLEDTLAPLGARLERIPNDTGEKANLIASFGPDDVPGYILSGHTDVVPVDGQAWASDPFELTERDGKLYARGSADMKGFLACCLTRAPRMAAAPLKIPLHLAFSYDEEVGCLGVRSLIGRLGEWKVPPRGCIVGEPTSMDIVTSHKAKRAFRAFVTGTPGHSSRAPHFVNAVDFAAEFVVELRRFGREIEACGPRDPLFDVPFTTTHIGLIEGGEALNIVPEHCHLEFELRALPNEDVDAMADHIQRFVDTELLPRMKDVSSEADFRLENTIAYPGLETAPEEDIVVVAKRLAGRNDHRKVAYGTEGGLFSKTGNIPTVVCGPGDIDRAHKANEFITRDELAACEAFIDALIEYASR